MGAAAMRLDDGLGPLALEQNLAIMAGAGAGKTYSLITIGLHLLSGARAEPTPLQPAELCLLTFTDKAAAEMRSRLRERLDALATGEARASDEADLRASFAALGRSFPGPEFWRRVRDDLGSAWIGTFHSLCAQLLRRAPAGFGVDPSFKLLDEREATLLRRDTAERVVLDALERREPEVVDLCRELGFSARGRVLGMVGALGDVLVKLREEGLSADQVAITRKEEARAAFDAALERVREAASRAASLEGPRGRFFPCVSACLRALDGMKYETFLHADRWPALRAAIEAERTIANQRNELGEALKDLKWNALGRDRPMLKGLLEHYAAVDVVRHEAAFRRLLGELQDRHRGELRKRAALDFSELLIRARDLLRDHPVVRREVQDRMRALLVDEFQDTNRLQLELVTLLSERREGGPRPVEASGVLELPLQPAFVCAVGDRKQSIYEFRGADVSVFGQLAALVERNGGRRHYLKTNRRSVPGLITFFNRMFRSVLVAREGAASARDYEVVYQPEGDDLEPHRTLRAGRLHVERVVYEPAERAPESRAQDATLVARKIRQLLAPRSGLKIQGADEKVRPAVGRDVAILFRRFTYLEVYRQALARAGIPHRVVRGRGFYAAQEVVDLASLLSVIADPTDALSFAAVLRSPLVALSDASLYRLADQCGGRLHLKSVRAVERPALVGFGAGELERLDRFLDLHHRLRSERDRLGLRVLLQVALEETAYRVALAGSPFGEQALANVEKLLELAGRWDATGAGDCQAFAAELLALADAEPAEAQADVMDAGDERAVSLLTIHQAKGLEWPVVVVPDLCAGPMPQTKRVLFDRSMGLGLKPWVEGELEVGRSPRQQQIADELARREEAEYRRLLYVAMTRARDHLVLSGQCKGMRSATWRGYLDRALESDAELRALVADAKEGDVPEMRVSGGVQGSLLLDGEERVVAAEARCEQPLPLQPRTAVLPVTHLQSYVLCERRYLYAHVVGLAEFPIHFEVDAEPELEPLLPGRTRSPNDPRARGTLAHALLEKVDLEAAADPGRLDEALRRLLWELGQEPDTQDAREIAAWARGFLLTPYAASLRGARVMREVPFALKLDAPGSLSVFLKGQIDLLVIDEAGTATVIDYKASERHPEGLQPYGFQLDCYALAARKLVGADAPLRTGIAFLKEKNPGPDFRADARPEALAAVEARLAAAAADLVARSRGTDFRGRDAAYCASIRCGYQYRCHPSAGSRV